MRSDREIRRVRMFLSKVYPIVLTKAPAFALFAGIRINLSPSSFTHEDDQSQGTVKARVPKSCPYQRVTSRNRGSEAFLKKGEEKLRITQVDLLATTKCTH